MLPKAAVADTAGSEVLNLTDNSSLSYCLRALPLASLLVDMVSLVGG